MNQFKYLLSGLAGILCIIVCMCSDGLANLLFTAL